MTSTPPPRFIGAVEDEWLMYSDVAADYTRHAPIGFGASSVVYEAVYHHKDPATGKLTDLPCALKVLNLDKLAPSALKLLTRETQLMSLSKHPNVLRVRGTWMMGPQLYIAMRLMNKGSVADIMKYSFIDGLEEEVVKCILHQALQGLNYLHVNGFIHRDIKAANLLVDDDGTVLLGDLGVAVSLADDEDTGQNGMMSAVRKGIGAPGGPPLVYGAKPTPKPATAPKQTIGKRKSFVGTPSWMAPEVISQQHYDSAADIWSLGITVLEMCSGRAPGSRERDVKRVLLATLQNAPPTLDRDGGTNKYSKALKDFVDCCLVKDPAQRPSAEKLLKHDIFKGVKKKSYLVGTLLAGLPPLSERQERHLVNHHHPHQAHKPKAHPLALGSPSMTSIHSRHSWDWTFSNPATPRSTIYSGKHTPPGSHHSPSGSVTSLHDVHKHPPRSRSRTSTTASLDARPNSISPTRMRQHSRVPSYVPSHLEPEVEDEAEDVLDLNAINAGLEELGGGIETIPRARNGGLRTQEDNEILSTPHVHAVEEALLVEDPDALALQDQDPEPSVLQPPELSSSASSSGRASSSSPRTSPSSLARQLTHTKDQSSSTANPVQIQSQSNPTTPQNSPQQTPFFQTSGGGVLPMRSKTERPEGPQRSTSRLWSKVKNAASSSAMSSKKSLVNLTSSGGGGDEKKGSFKSGAKAFLLERTRSSK